MSLIPEAFDEIPEETARIARAAFPKGNPYMRIRDELGPIFKDEAFAAVFARRGQPAESPGRLALVTILQFAEDLSDRQAADAVRGRIDWKYVLGLEMGDPGFDASVLSEFRARLISGGIEQILFETVLDRLRAAHLLKARTRQRTDSTHVLAAVHARNRLECVGETMRHALNRLAVVAREWSQQQAQPEWFERYGRRFEDYRVPAGRAQREALAETIGRDGHLLLSAIERCAPEWMRHVPAVEILRQVWVQQFYVLDGSVRWRRAEDVPPASRMISSPYDVEARYGKKRDVEWKGYKVHLTECCDAQAPMLITDVQTMQAASNDVDMLPKIAADLAARELLPDEHLVDAGYMSAPHLVAARDTYGVRLIGPVLADPSWQAKAPDGIDLSRFVIDWEGKVVTCPQGEASRSWSEQKNAHGHDVVRVVFGRASCAGCAARERCTKSATGPRTLTLSARPNHEALQQARTQQRSDEFKEKYKARAGIEGTISQAIRQTGLRRSRYAGEAKTHLQHLAAATAINVLRAGAWLLDLPRATTRRSAFAALAPKAA